MNNGQACVAQTRILASRDRYDEVVDAVASMVSSMGAKVVVGGDGMPQGIDKGWYVQPTVFANVSDSMRIANDSQYGLAGSVFTADVERGLDVARRVRTGTYGVNQYTMDFVAPFGGYKGSGVGRELGKEGLGHYVELKSIVAPGARVAAAG